MLTPEQVKKHHFRSAGKGLYRSDEVDEYVEDVVKSFQKAADAATELKRSNDELYQRVEALANALNQLRAERELIQKTMILAQKAADELTSQAQDESTRLLRESRDDAERQRASAREEAEGLVKNARREVDKLLLEAQAHAENIIAHSRAKAESLFEEARGKAQQELTRISAETQREQQEFARLKQESARFRNNLLDAVAQQMEFIEKLPFEDESKPAPLPVPAPTPIPAPVLIPVPDPDPEPEFEPMLNLESDPELFPPEPSSEPSDPLAELEALEEPLQERIHLI